MYSICHAALAALHGGSYMRLVLEARWAQLQITNRHRMILLDFRDLLLPHRAHGVSWIPGGVSGSHWIPLDPAGSQGSVWIHWISGMVDLNGSKMFADSQIHRS